MQPITDLIFNILAGFFIIAHAIATLIFPVLGYKPAATTVPATSRVSTTPNTSQAAPFPAATSARTISKVPARALTQPSASVKPPVSATQSSPALSPEQINANARAALVNVLCVTKIGGPFAPISGSGVIVDSRGVVLTNAHVGQFFLLRDFRERGFIDCVVRTGSPAV